MSKSNVELLASLKKSNKVRRLKLAIKAGFSSYELYKTHLETTSPEAVTKKKSKKKPVIHVVDIVDCSSSMGGSKMDAAIKGTIKGLDSLKDEKRVNYTYTLCHFSYASNIGWPCFMKSVEKSVIKGLRASGLTALYDGIGKTFAKLEEKVKEGEKVLINIYTDGGENDSTEYTSHDISRLIEEGKGKGYTVTFIGTKLDVSHVITRLKIDKTNTMTYDGTGAGLEKSLNQTVLSRAAYSANVAKGKDVSRGFYKKLN